MKLKDSNGNPLEMEELVKNVLIRYKTAVVEASESDHSKTSVFELRKLVLGHGFRVLSESKRIELEISRFPIAIQSLLQCNKAEDFKKANPEKNLRHRAEPNKKVVRFRGTHFLYTWEGPDFREYVAEGTQHSDTACVKGKTREYRRLRKKLDKTVNIEKLTRRDEKVKG